MWFWGILIGAATFLIIGALHPVVIKCEYYFGSKIWPAFLAVGVVCLVFSALVPWLALSAILGVTGFSFLWGIHELFAQSRRVSRGWYPAHPHRKHLYHKTKEDEGE
ncbi:MAG: DUF4491 family protein [Clostridiales Family XIII bacterium]|jgi:hypothetical protein|nr:DUF4491 family protein [Clostridiales Family XIII bacterium]